MVVLVTLNLRPFLTAIGPLGPAIQAHTGMGLQALSWLTLLPMLLFGAGTWLAPAALHHWGPVRAMSLALGLLILGCGLRLAADVSLVLLLTAALCGAGVALAQGMLPGLIKLHSPQRLAAMMGVFSAALMTGGALGAQLTPLALQWGVSWQSALALWALPVLPALVLAMRQLGGLSLPRNAGGPLQGDTDWLLRRRRTWLLMLSFGLMNSGYVAMVAWLAPYYQSLGRSAAYSGSLVAVVSMAQAAAALILPLLAARWQDRRPWIWFTLACQAAGFAALAAWPLSAPLMSATLLGMGLGGSFTFFMLVALDHLPSPLQAGALNALMQGGGFILSALAPWIMALLHQHSGSFVTGWWLQMGIALAVAIMVLYFNPRHFARVMQAPRT